MGKLIRAKRTDELGRAFAGSQLQIQLSIDLAERRSRLNGAIQAATGVSSPLHWVSELAPIWWTREL
jgi:hypothetical protein